MAADYVCVRILNINDVDMNVYPFDYDLTMSIVLANADGTVYHRYGGRDHLSPMNLESLMEIMKEGLTTHRDYLAHPHPPPAKPRERIGTLVNERLPGLISPIYGCFHCHYVREARQYLSLEAGQWTPDQFWVWPLPQTVGLVMDQRRQYLVESVLPESPAESAGIRAGDRLLSLGEQRILTKYDLQWVLDQSTNEPVSIPFTLRRNDTVERGRLELAAAWKTGDPRDYLWRVRNVFTEHMIKFLPTPGFTGSQLTAPELVSLGLPEGRFALRIGQLNYGTYLAGVRLGDIILSAGDRSDFPTLRDFYQHCELTRRAGQDLKLQLHRQGSSLSLMVSRNYLNYSRVERAPRVTLGFIVQELPGSAGLRVGNVADGSSAEKTGLLVGDRIVSVDARNVGTADELSGMLNQKSPGDLLTLKVTRDGEMFQFGFALPGLEESRSDVARLSGKVREAGQDLTCIVSLRLPAGQHVYSAHKLGFGMPTRLEFRGTGYKLAGPLHEPAPRKIVQTGLEPMWVLDGQVELRQAIRVTDPGRFQLLLRVYAQVCDDRSCHEFRAVIGNNGSDEGFTEYHGRFEEAAVPGQEQP